MKNVLKSWLVSCLHPHEQKKKQAQFAAKEHLKQKQSIQKHLCFYIKYCTETHKKTTTGPAPNC